MSRLTKRIITIILCFSVLIVSFVVSIPAHSNSLQDQINDLERQSQAKEKEIRELKNKKAEPQAQANAIRAKIAIVQAQINACNAEISKINSKMASNKKKIADRESQIEKDKLEFQIRIRAIYMSNFDSNIKMILGADDFAEFLQLSQLTASISAKDKALIENLTAEIAELEELNSENQKLLDSQVAIRSTIKAKQDELEAQENEVNKILGGINSEINAKEKENSAIEKEIRAKQKALEDSIRNSSYGAQSFVNPNTGFQWPVNGFRTISAGFQSNDSVHKGHHNGIDISGGGIQGQPIRAIADGIVTTVNNSCTHNYKKYGNCCGNGYGNYCVINHGTIKGANYQAYYAHAQKIIVSPGQKVTQGQVIGYVGTTGWSTGYHLHLGILKNNVWVNPYPLFF